MRVLHLFNEYLPKTEVWAYNLIHACSDIDHFICADYYHNLNGFGSGVEILNREQGLRKKKRAINSQQKNYRKFFQLFYIISEKLSCGSSIQKLVFDNDISIIHVHFGTTAAAKWDIIEHINLPMCISFYGYDYKQAIGKDSRLRKIYLSIFGRANVILTEGNYGKLELMNLGAPKEKLHKLPLGISISDTIQSRVFKKNGCLHLVQIASFTEKKGQLYTIIAFLKSLENCRSEIKLTLVGDNRSPRYSREVRNLINKSKHQDKIQIIDWIEFEHINSFLIDFDVFIHPSVHAEDGDCEGGAPVILLHAQSLGLPVITTNHCDIPEQILDRETGYLCEERNIDSLTDAILNFDAMDNKVYQKHSQAAKNFIRDNYDVNASAVKLSDIYRAINN